MAEKLFGAVSSSGVSWDVPAPLAVPAEHSGLSKTKHRSTLRLQAPAARAGAAISWLIKFLLGFWPDCCACSQSSAQLCVPSQALWAAQPGSLRSHISLAPVAMEASRKMK